MHNEQYDYYFRLGEREGIENQLLLSAVHKFKSILPERHFSQFPHCYIQRWIQGRTASPHSTVRNIFFF